MVWRVVLDWIYYMWLSYLSPKYISRKDLEYQLYHNIEKHIGGEGTNTSAEAGLWKVQLFGKDVTTEIDSLLSQIQKFRVQWQQWISRDKVDLAPYWEAELEQNST